MKNIIYYFTGTGNSLFVAEKLAVIIGDCGTEPVTCYDASQKISAERIGLVFPTYYWGLPNIVKKFIAEFQLTKQEKQPYLFISYTFGGYSGVTPHLTEKLMSERGLTLNAAFGFQLPMNFILSTFRVPNEKKQEREFQKADERFPSIAKIILNKEEYFEKEPLRFKPFHFVGYRLTASEEKKIPAKDNNFVVSGQCKGCGFCAEGCPVGNIDIENKRPVFKHHCEFCLQCLHVCPVEAIDYGTETRGRKRYKNPKIRLFTGGIIQDGFNLSNPHP